MSLIDRLQIPTNSLPAMPLPDVTSRGLHGATLVGFTADKAERVISSAGFGFIRGYFGERGLIGGAVPVDVAAGLALSTLAVGLTSFTGGRSRAAQHIARAGDAGVMSFFNALGTRLGGQVAGVQYVTSKKSLPNSRSIVMGGYLTPDELAKFGSTAK